MTRPSKHWMRWAALGAAFFLVVLLWLALVAGRVAGEPLRLTLWADCLPLDRAGLRAPSRCPPSQPGSNHQRTLLSPG